MVLSNEGSRWISSTKTVLVDLISFSNKEGSAASSKNMFSLARLKVTAGFMDWIRVDFPVCLGSKRKTLFFDVAKTWRIFLSIICSKILKNEHDVYRKSIGLIATDQGMLLTWGATSFLN